MTNSTSSTLTNLGSNLCYRIEMCSAFSPTASVETVTSALV